MLKEALDTSKVSGIRIALGAPTLTHLLFADDIIIFMKANSKDIYELMNILNKYQLASGQRVNL